MRVVNVILIITQLIIRNKLLNCNIFCYLTTQLIKKLPTDSIKKYSQHIKVKHSSFKPISMVLKHMP